MSALRVGIVVQGEGRGHMTQALALARILTDAGHRIVRVFVGASPHRSVPRYFVDGMPAPVERFDAPTQVPDRQGRAVSVHRTGFDALRRMPLFFRAGWRIHRGVRNCDVVVNLLDLIGGLSRVVFATRAPCIAIAHNYLFSHPCLEEAPGRPKNGAFLRLYTKLTTLRTRGRVALAFAPMGQAGGRHLHLAPPLLREGLDRLDVRDGGYLLAYALNRGYGTELARWQAGRGDVTVHCYVDGGPSALGTNGEGFFVHDLDEEAFLRHLAGCRAYVGSAGFESICEAHYLGKPVLAVPTEGQPEQALNAWDAERCGTARRGSYDDLDRFWEDPRPPDAERVRAFRAWVAQGPEQIVNIIERASRRASISVGGDAA